MAKSSNIILFSLKLITIGVLALILTNSLHANAISCAECVAKLNPCVGYLVGKDPAISVGCCSGAQALDNIAVGSPTEKRAICECLKEAAKHIPIIIDRAKQIPPFCHLQTKFEVSPDIDCSKYVL